LGPGQAGETFSQPDSEASYYYSLEDNCPFCKRKIFVEELMAQWRKSYLDKTIPCPYPSCAQAFVPRLTRLDGASGATTSFELVSPAFLHY